MSKWKYKKIVSAVLTLTLTATSFVVPTFGASKSSDADYVEGEYLATVESLEEAEAMAAAYNMDLKSYAYGIAVFTETGVASLSSIDEDLVAEFPELYPNERFELYDAELTATSTSQYHHDLLDTAEAWKTATGSGVTVAIIDTGIDIDHAEFTGQALANSYNSDEDKYGTEYVEDNHGHGSHVAGIVAAKKDDANDVYGVAPDATLMIIKGDYVEGSQHYFTMSSLATGIKHAVDKGANIINMSLGTSTEPVGTALKEAVDYAVANGVLIIAASGNSSVESVSYPAAYDGVIAVSAVDSSLNFATSYSNYGDAIDISAPGSGVYSANYNGGYTTKSGTSMASPMVAGVAALVLSTNSSYTINDLEDALLDTASEKGDLGHDKYYGNGVLNAYAAVLGTDDLHKVTYHYDEETTTTYVIPGDTLTAPTNPTKGSYTFLGWATEANGSTYFDFTTAISANTDLYADWFEPAATPDAPTLASVGTDSVTLIAVDGAEYGMSTSANGTPSSWQESNTFTGLTANTTYYFYMRIKATATEDISAISGVMTITTLTEDMDDTVDFITYVSATYGATATLTATVPSDSDSTTGTVTFILGTEVLGTVENISAGETATLVYDTTTKKMSVGSNSVTVSYGDDADSDIIGVIVVTLDAKSIATATVSSVATQTYTGSALEPSITVTDGTTTLVKDTDYTVAYSNNTAVGTATITISGMGYYGETITTTFAIQAATSTSTSSGGGGGGGGGGSSSGGTSVDTEDSTTTATVKISSSTSGKNTTANITTDDIEDAIDDALDEVSSSGEAVVELDVSTKSYTTKLTIEVPSEALSSVATSDVELLKITSDMGSFDLENDVLEYLGDLAGDNAVTFVIEAKDVDDVLTAAQLLYMDAVVAYDVSIYVGDEYVGEFDGETICVSFPFVVEDGENADYIVVWYIDDDGNKTQLVATYDADEEKVSFDAYHFSYYVIGYDESVEEEEEVVAELYDDTEEVENPFSDVSENDFFYKPVLWALNNSITSGTTETTFEPYASATRGQTATLIWKAMGSPTPTLTENPFADVYETDYYYKAVLWAVEEGITSGTSATTFEPNATVTRGQIVTFLWNNANRPEGATSNPFWDVPESMYYYNPILWAVEEGITSGTSASTFDPETLCNRGEIVTFLYRNFATS
ncbi:S8 family serine peptidase [Chakrabartyella piscis]|uniref:S8 family serine peptidase n=1 Tax=Chakrabartyella piscis TaxID=2918914 RepID=UPI002958696C|nr:S8 family serine peptidase [Chakrabartyella piscis]